jgi:lipoprotein-releasing system ATP-binding protein
MSLLCLEHVSKRFAEGREEITVLEEVSLEVDDGDFVGLWGMRRSGKTTLLRVAAGSELPTSGCVWFAGRDVARMSPNEHARLRRRGGIGLLCGDWRLERDEHGLEHVALPLLSDGMTLREARKPALRALERVGIGECAHLHVSGLSQSERIRLGLAQILVHTPRLLLVDEPAVLVRPSEGLKLYELLRSLNRDLGLTIIVASEEIAPLRTARRVMSIGDGRLRSMDEPGTIVPFPERRAARQRSRQ